MDTEKKQKRIYYTIGDVAEYFGVNESTLRYWEDEFDIITPRRSSRGVRFYNQEDIEGERPDPCRRKETVKRKPIWGYPE